MYIHILCKLVIYIYIYLNFELYSILLNIDLDLLEPRHSSLNAPRGPCPRLHVIKLSLLSQALCLLQHNSSMPLEEVCWELVPEDRVARGGGGNERYWDVDCMIYP